MKHARDLRLLLQPARDLERRSPRAAAAERRACAGPRAASQASSGLTDWPKVAAGPLEPLATRLAWRSPSRASRRNGRRHIWCRRGSRGRRRPRAPGRRAGVAQVLSSRVDEPRSPAPTAQIAGTSCTSKVSDPGLSRKIARGVLADQLGDAGADQRVVIARRDPAALEHAVAEAARRRRRRCRPSAARRRRDSTRQQRGRDRREAGRIEHGARRAGLELGQRLGQRPLRRRAVQAIIEASRRPARRRANRRRCRTGWSRRDGPAG